MCLARAICIIFTQIYFLDEKELPKEGNVMKVRYVLQLLGKVSLSCLQQRWSIRTFGDMDLPTR